MIRRDLAASKGAHIVLLRHGETEWSLSGQHTGSSDIPLTAKGEEQARIAGDALEGQSFGLVLTSPRQRAIRTAQLAGFGEHAIVDPDLSEWDYGSYEGRTSAQISADLGRPWSLWTDGVPQSGPGAGESGDQVLARAQAALERVLSVIDEGNDVLLVSHGHFLRVFASNWIGLGYAGGQLLCLDTASISALGFEHTSRVLRLWNRTPYTERALGSDAAHATQAQAASAF